MEYQLCRRYQDYFLDSLYMAYCQWLSMILLYMVLAYMYSIQYQIGSLFDNLVFLLCHRLQNLVDRFDKELYQKSNNYQRCMAWDYKLH